MPVQPASPRRRLLLGVGLSLAGGLLGAGRRAWAALPERRVALHHVQTGETVRTVYFAQGRYLEEGLREISRVLRDWRTDEVIGYDPRLLDMLSLLQRRLAPAGPVEVVSGYRSPATNAMLRRRYKGVARNSLHMEGKAIDLRFPGCPLDRLHEAALALEAGGVGYYPAADFLHLDSGPVRSWSQASWLRSQARRSRAAGKG
ncbi:DUF882 domain-containing protein [Marinimicrococcus flavescens]|uniref:Murein endopeptidase K n=1 Tax=Marinimicrococcus flavescens TaxID=3031815 RepID=A0AAP3XR09_9PROT|nr:DUF882 domain-containing protein [Marinimicrococcus flavescens]